MKLSFTTVVALLIGLAAAEHGGHRHVHRRRVVKRNGDTIWVTVTDTVIATQTKTVWVDPTDPTPKVKAEAYGGGDRQRLDYSNFKQTNKRPEPLKEKKKYEPPKQDDVVKEVKASTSDDKEEPEQPPSQPPSQPAPDSPFDPVQWQKKQEEIQQGLIEQQKKYEQQQAGGAPPVKEAPVVQSPPPPPKQEGTQGGNQGGSPGGSSNLNTVPGIMTYYDPNGAYGACGWGIAQDAPEVALAASMMGDKAKCGKMIIIKGPNGSFPAKVADKCGACETDARQGINHIDVPRAYAAKISGFTYTNEEAFGKSQLAAVGHLPDVTWDWA